MASPAALREIARFVRQADADGVREALVNAPESPDALGLNGNRHHLAELPDNELLAVVGDAVRRHRLDAEAERRAAAIEKSRQAASELSATARWQENHVQLNPRLVLGDMLAAPAKFIAFHVDQAEVPVLRNRLQQVRRIAHRLPALTVTLDAEALRFRWKHGLGGLNLRPQQVRREDRDDVLHVVVARPAPIQQPVRQRRDGSWLHDVLGDLGFL